MRDAEEAAPCPPIIWRCHPLKMVRWNPVLPRFRWRRCLALSAGVAIIEDRPKMPSAGLTPEALKLAGIEGARLRGLEVEAAKNGRTLITANSFLRAYRAYQTAPAESADDERMASRVNIVIDTGEVFLDDNLWLGPQSELRLEEIRGDAALMAEYLASFANFFGNAEGAISSYWTFLS